MAKTFKDLFGKLVSWENLLVANDDRSASGTVAGLPQKLRAAKVRVEPHILGRGGHGFNLGERSDLSSVRGWPQRLAVWLADSDILHPPPPAEEKRTQ